jgi:hypothetical protein
MQEECDLINPLRQYCTIDSEIDETITYHVKNDLKDRLYDQVK